jgi:L-asparaginase II
MALAYARLGTRWDGNGAADRVVTSILADPFLAAGTGRLCTEVIRGSRGRVLAKVGADGVYCAAIPKARLGVALKVEDADDESARTALLATLEALAPGVVKVPESFRAPAIRNTLGEAVGHFAAIISLERGPR